MPSQEQPSPPRAAVPPSKGFEGDKPTGSSHRRVPGWAHHCSVSNFPPSHGSWSLLGGPSASKERWLFAGQVLPLLSVLHQGAKHVSGAMDR